MNFVETLRLETKLEEHPFQYPPILLKDMEEKPIRNSFIF